MFLRSAPFEGGGLFALPAAPEDVYPFDARAPVAASQGSVDPSLPHSRTDLSLREPRLFVPAGSSSSI